MLCGKFLISRSSSYLAKHEVFPRTVFWLTSRHQQKNGGFRTVQSPIIRKLHGTTNRAEAEKDPNVSASSRPSQGKNQGQKRSTPKLLLLLGIALGGYGIYAFTASEEDNIRSFKPFSLESRESISSTSAIFTLRPTKRAIQIPPRDQTWSVEFKQPYIQIGRDYTPLPVFSDSSAPDDGTLKFIIRKDPKGEMSRYLFSLPLGAELDIRGPKTEFKISPTTQHLIFFAGGTGIAPALQAADALLSRPQNSSEATAKPTVHILWANRHREDCVGAPAYSGEDDSSRTSWLSLMGSWLSASKQEAMSNSPHTHLTKTHPIVHDIRHLQSRYPGQVHASYFIDEERTFITAETIKHALSSPESVLSSASGLTTQIIVSGPEGFVGYVAGPKLLQYTITRPGQNESDSAASQGPIGGLLGQVGGLEQNTKVFKL